MRQPLRGLACQVSWISSPVSFFFEISALASRAVRDDRLYVARNTIPYLLGFASSLQLCVPMDKVGISKNIYCLIYRKIFLLRLPQSPKEVRTDVCHFCMAVLLQKPRVLADPPFEAG